MVRRWSSACASVTWLSARPSVQAKPALVVASAWKPSCSSARALPASHGFGMTKQPEACRRWNVSMRSRGAVMIRSLVAAARLEGALEAGVVGAERERAGEGLVGGVGDVEGALVVRVVLRRGLG